MGVGPYVIGVDIGTGSTKGVLVSAQGDVVASARRDHAMSLPQAGWAELDAESVFWADFVAIVRELIEGRDVSAIAAVACSGLGPCVVRCDRSGRPRRPAILYGIDSRAGSQIERMTEMLGAAPILERCGKALSSQAGGPKLLWLKEEEPELWHIEDHWHSAHTFVAERLTGEWVMDHNTASQFDPLYDVRTQLWAVDWVTEIFGELSLPQLVWPGELIGAVTADGAADTGLPVGLPVVAGTIDAWAEAYGAGVRRPGDLMIMYGSTMFLVQVVPTCTVGPGLWTTSGIEPGSHTIAAGMATSGSLTEWIRDVTGVRSFSDLVAEATQVPPGSDGLVMLPYFAGERSPIFDPDARGLMLGLSLRHRRGHLARAAYEGIAFGLRQILDVVAEAVGPPTRAVAVGGGTQGNLWTQIVSDVTGVKQQVPRETIGASYGIAQLAAVGVGAAPSDSDWATIARTIVPNRSSRRVYDELYDVYCGLYPATMRFAHALAGLDHAVRS